MKNGYVKSSQPALCDLRFVFNHFDRFARESAGHMRGGGCIRLHPAAFPVEKLALYAAGAGAALFAVLFVPYHQCRLESVFSSAGDAGTATASFQPREGESFKERLSLCD